MMFGTLSTYSRKIVAELTVNAAQVLKQRNVSAELFKVGNLSAWRWKRGYGDMPAFKLSLNYDAAI